MSDERIDPFTGTVVHVVGSRQARPNQPAEGCPFCPGGLEAPDDYVVRSFVNRWPSMPDDRCEVLLYSPQHDATLWSLGVDGVRAVVDLWAARTVALGARDDVGFVLVFENRGAEVGATIAHPHGQIYAYDHVPVRPATVFAAGWRPDVEPGGERSVVADDRAEGWVAFVPFASRFATAVTLAPRERVPDLAHLSDVGRDELATMIVDVFARLDRLFDRPLPYMMWLMQRPTGATADADQPDAWMHLEIVSPWRAAGVQRFIAAAEVASGEYTNPVAPEDLAQRLRDLA